MKHSDLQAMNTMSRLRQRFLALKQRGEGAVETLAFLGDDNQIRILEMRIAPLADQVPKSGVEEDEEGRQREPGTSKTSSELR